MDETRVVIAIPQAAYDAGEIALASYPFAQVDHMDAASDVLHAAVPLVLAAAYTELADQLTELANHKRRSGNLNQTIRAVGLVEGITVIRERAARLSGRS